MYPLATAAARMVRRVCNMVITALRPPVLFKPMFTGCSNYRLLTIAGNDESPLAPRIGSAGLSRSQGAAHGLGQRAKPGPSSLAPARPSVIIATRLKNRPLQQTGGANAAEPVSDGGRRDLAARIDQEGGRYCGYGRYTRRHPQSGVCRRGEWHGQGGSGG